MVADRARYVVGEAFRDVLTRTVLEAVHQTLAAPVWEFRMTSFVPVPVLNWACETSVESTGLLSRST